MYQGEASGSTTYPSPPCAFQSCAKRLLPGSVPSTAAVANVPRRLVAVAVGVPPWGVSVVKVEVALVVGRAQRVRYPVEVVSRPPQPMETILPTSPAVSASSTQLSALVAG